MSRSTQTVNTTARGVFVVYDASADPVTGLVQGDFTAFVEFNGANSAVAVTITEVGNGRYTYTFVPNVTGHWGVLIRNAANDKRGWLEDFDVS